MKLNEIAKPVNPEIQRINQELRHIGVTDYKILPDLSVDVDGDIDMSFTQNPFHIQFNMVNGFFDCSGTNISSLKGGPRYVGSTIDCNDTQIETLVGAPQRVDLNFYCINTPNMKSLHGVEKWIPNIIVGGMIWCDQTHLLGLSLIEGINKVRFWNPRPDVKGWMMFNISHHDPFQFQEQLLEHGLTEQAQL